MTDELREILREARWTQDELAHRLDVSPKTLSFWLTGKTTPRGKYPDRIRAMYFDIVGRTEIDDDRLKELKKQALNTHLDLRELLTNGDLLKLTTLYLTYHTNTIEGSTMTIEDVATVLNDENAVISNKSYREQAEARNHRTAFLFLLDQLKAQGDGFEWTTELILETHKRLMNSLMDDAGSFRQYGVRVLGSSAARTNYVSVPQKIDDLLAYMNTPTDDVIERLAKTHAVFEQIHPFGDGNGRTGRLIMFTQAMQYGIVPPLVLKERKRAYYKYIDMANQDDDYRLLSMFVAESVLSTDELLK